MTELQRLEALEERLEKAESRARTYIITVLLIMIAALVLATGARGAFSQQGLVGAESFVLFDSARRPRVILKVSGNQRDDAPTLVFMDQRGNKRFVIEAGLLGRSILSAYDSSEKNRIFWWIRDDGETRFIFSNAEGVNKMEFSVSTNGLPQIILRDANGRPSLQLGVTERGGLIRLLNTSGEVVFQAP